MQKNIIKLIRLFHKISYKSWIKGTSSFNKTGNVGLTFENELHKKADSKYLPDFEGIEIKCTTRYSNYPLNLFTMAMTGNTVAEINRLIEKYGYYTNDYPDKKILIEDFNKKTTNLIDGKWIFKLEIEKQEDKLFLAIYDKSNNLVEKETYIKLSNLHNRLITKLNTLAFIKASKKNINNTDYFRYYEISIYKLTSFDKFLELLRKKIINVTIMGRISKSGEKKGQYRNKNLIFNIEKENIELLYEKIYYYNHDKNIRFNKRGI